MIKFDTSSKYVFMNICQRADGRCWHDYSRKNKNSNRFPYQYYSEHHLIFDCVKSLRGLKHLHEINAFFFKTDII